MNYSLNDYEQIDVIFREHQQKLVESYSITVKFQILKTVINRQRIKLYLF